MPGEDQGKAEILSRTQFQNVGVLQPETHLLQSPRVVARKIDRVSHIRVQRQLPMLRCRSMRVKPRQVSVSQESCRLCGCLPPQEAGAQWKDPSQQCRPLTGRRARGAVIRTLSPADISTHGTGQTEDAAKASFRLNCLPNLGTEGLRSYKTRPLWRIWCVLDRQIGLNVHTAEPRIASP